LVSGKRLPRTELLFLGTGGADTTPSVGCLCRVCQEARRKGGRFVRNGPALFLTGPSLLFDTPEDIARSLERERIHRVRRLIYTHWHPDHTMGRRVLEQLNLSLFNPQAKRVTEVWLPTWVRADFHKRLALEEQFQFFERMGIVRVREIAEGETLHVDGITLRPFRMPQPGLTCFLLQHGRKRIVLAMDDTKDWKPGPNLLQPDLLVLEAGWFEYDPKGKRIVPEGHWIRREESSFEEILDIIERVQARETVLTHIEEVNSRSYTDYLKLEKKYSSDHLRFAYDGLRIRA